MIPVQHAQHSGGMKMDNSVISIEMLARFFNHSLRIRGFTRAIHREMNPSQCSSLLQQHFVVLGLVVAGELELELSEAHLIYGVGEEFMIPANTYFQATAGHTGVRLLFARQRSHLSSVNETINTV